MRTNNQQIAVTVPTPVHLLIKKISNAGTFSRPRLCDKKVPLSLYEQMIDDYILFTNVVPTKIQILKKKIAVKKYLFS
jgi:hypothetical protein